MKFDLYIELALHVTDARLLALLRFPHGVDLRGEWMARWWSRGKTKQMHCSDREKILQRIGSEQVNELTLKWKPSGVVSYVEFLKLNGANLTFYPSPFSELWAEVPIHQLKSHVENRARMNFRNLESALTRAHEVPFPSILECFFNLATTNESLNDTELHNMSVKWIRAVMPEGLAGLEIFGYGCVHGTCRKMLMTMSLGFPEIDQLGAKFENIYPILVGPKASCEGLAAALGCGSVVSISNNSPSAVLSIGPDQIQFATRNPAAKKWIVERPNVPDKLGPRVFVVPPKRPPN